MAERGDQVRKWLFRGARVVRIYLWCFSSRLRFAVLCRRSVCRRTWTVTTVTFVSRDIARRMTSWSAEPLDKWLYNEIESREAGKCTRVAASQQRSASQWWWKDAATTHDELAPAAETGRGNWLAETRSRGLRLATPAAGMIHQCLLVAWIVLAVTWFVWETWLGGSAEQEVSLDVDGQPRQPSPISHQQVTYLLILLTFITFSSHFCCSLRCVICCSQFRYKF